PTPTSVPPPLPLTTLFRSIMTLVPLPTLVFPIPFPLFWREQIDHPEKLGTIRFSLPHPFDSTAHAKSAPMFRLPTIVPIPANRLWLNHIAGASPPNYNLLSTRREFRSMLSADRRADVRVPVWVWEEDVQSQPIVRLSAHVSYSYFHFSLADHVFEIACNFCFPTRTETLQVLKPRLIFVFGSLFSFLSPFRHADMANFHLCQPVFVFLLANPRSAATAW